MTVGIWQDSGRKYYFVSCWIPNLELTAGLLTRAAPSCFSSHSGHQTRQGLALQYGEKNVILSGQSFALHSTDMTKGVVMSVSCRCQDLPSQSYTAKLVWIWIIVTRDNSSTVIRSAIDWSRLTATEKLPSCDPCLLLMTCTGKFQRMRWVDKDSTDHPVTIKTKSVFSMQKHQHQNVTERTYETGCGFLTQLQLAVTSSRSVWLHLSAPSSPVLKRSFI